MRLNPIRHLDLRGRLEVLVLADEVLGLGKRALVIRDHGF